MKKFNFPKIQKVEINYFSLYKKQQSISLENYKAVFCLAGANGLGKSTFVNILNYGLTGIVKKSDADFAWYKSITGFYAKSKSFATDYFDGRINENDRDLAEVTIHFTAGERQYKITRGFFESEELRDLEISENGHKLDFSESTPNDLFDNYTRNLTQDIGLSSFDQFVFLQIYVLTFDETHQLLFWDSNIMERVLHLFFGLDPSKARKADQLRKEVSKYDSDARNLQWDITKTRNELEKITEQSTSENQEATVDETELFEDHKGLQQDIDELYNKLEDVQDDLKDLEASFSDLSIKISSLKSEYDSFFNQPENSSFQIEQDKDVIRILNRLKYKIFESQDYEVELKALVQIIKDSKPIDKKEDDFISELQKIDEELHSLNEQLSLVESRRNRLLKEEKEINSQIQLKKESISKIEEENKDLIRKLTLPSNEDGLSALINSYKAQIDRIEKQKMEARKKRDEKKKELEPLETSMSIQYNDAESEFIPIFNSYAKRFLGLNIDIQLHITSKAASFKLDINESQRKKAHQLSESQRYFIDIALRMALIQLNANFGTLVIDTPEGSLDIAYEKRAGSMFSDFSNQGYNLILTANINSSKLLLQLAENCGKSGMHIERMTEWTTLSDVQQEEQEYIEEAFNQIEKALN